MDNQPPEQIIEILKWIGIVFAAGFIGYFGRYLSMMILEKIHKKDKADTRPAIEDKPSAMDSETDRIYQEKSKIEKKRLKLEKKKAKKEKN